MALACPNVVDLGKPYKCCKNRPKIGAASGSNQKGGQARCYRIQLQVYEKEIVVESPRAFVIHELEDQIPSLARGVTSKDHFKNISIRHGNSSPSDVRDSNDNGKS